MLIQLLLSLAICLIIAELFGTSRHIGRWWAFVLLISGFIPGIIAILTSPSATKSPTVGGRTHLIFGVMCVVFGILNAIILNPLSLLFFVIAIYLFQLSKSKIKNQKPKYYFNRLRNADMPNTSLVSDDRSLIEDLKRLFNAEIITRNEYEMKLNAIQNKISYGTLLEDLERLHFQGILTDEEYASKKKQIEETKQFVITSQNGNPPKNIVQLLILASLLLIFLFGIIYIFYSNGSNKENLEYEFNFSNQNKQQQTNYESEKLVLSPELKEEVRTPVITFVYCVIEFQTPELVQESSKRMEYNEKYNYLESKYVNYNFVLYNEMITVSEIEEIKDYTLDKGNKFLEEIERSTERSMSTAEFNLVNKVNALVNDFTEQNELKSNKSKITHREIFTFKSYTEALEHKRKHYER